MNRSNTAVSVQPAEDVNWLARPLVPGDWFQLTADETAEVLGQLKNYLQVTPEMPPFLDRAEVHGMRARTLDFYPGWLLVECQAALNSETVALFNFFFGPSGAILLDGRSDGLHAFNAMVQVAIENPARAAQYLMLFCSAVRSELGRFEIITDPGQIAFLPGQQPDQMALARSLVLPLSAQVENDAGIEFQAIVRYGDGLFSTRFRVPPNGRVEMLDDQPLEIEAGIETETFVGPFRLPQVGSQ
jgi:hypothetical protein